MVKLQDNKAVREGTQCITDQVDEARITSPSNSDAKILGMYKCNFQKKKRSFHIVQF